MGGNPKNIEFSHNKPSQQPVDNLAARKRLSAHIDKTLPQLAEKNPAEALKILRGFLKDMEKIRTLAPLEDYSDLDELERSLQEKIAIAQRALQWEKILGKNHDTPTKIYRSGSHVFTIELSQDFQVKRLKFGSSEFVLPKLISPEHFKTWITGCSLFLYSLRETIDPIPKKIHIHHPYLLSFKHEGREYIYHESPTASGLLLRLPLLRGSPKVEADLVTAYQEKDAARYFCYFKGDDITVKKVFPSGEEVDYFTEESNQVLVQKSVRNKKVVINKKRFLNGTPVSVDIGDGPKEGTLSSNYSYTDVPQGRREYIVTDKRTGDVLSKLSVRAIGDKFHQVYQEFSDGNVVYERTSVSEDWAPLGRSEIPEVFQEFESNPELYREKVTSDSQEKYYLLLPDGNKLLSFQTARIENPRLTHKQYITQLAKVLTTPEAWSRFFTSFMQYRYDSPFPNYPHASGTKYHKGSHWQPPEETLERVKDGRMRGDCEDYAFLGQAILKEQGIRAEVMGVKPHAFCVWIKKRPDGRYDIFSLDNGYHFTKNGVSYRTHGQKGLDLASQGFTSPELAMEAVLQLMENSNAMVRFNLAQEAAEWGVDTSWSKKAHVPVLIFPRDFDNYKGRYSEVLYNNADGGTVLIFPVKNLVN